MKTLGVPEAISEAAVSMLAPYFPGLTAARLEKSIAFAPEKAHSEQLLSRPEGAAALHVSLPTIDRMLACRELTRVTVRGRVFIRRSEIDRIISGTQQELQK